MNLSRYNVILGLLFIVLNINIENSFAEMPSGLFHSTTLSANPQNSIKVKLTSDRHGCYLGDFDLINQELRNSKTPKLLITLESLTSENKANSIKPLVNDVTGFDLTKGFIATFNLPKVSEPTHLALYVCKDSEGKGKCGGKPLIDVSTLADTYALKLNPGSNVVPPQPTLPVAQDKIYYFAYILLTKESVSVLKTELKETDYTQVEAYLSELGSKNAPAVTTLVKANNAITRSVQPKLETGVLTVNLPRMDQKSCLAGK